PGQVQEYFRPDDRRPASAEQKPSAADQSQKPMGGQGQEGDKKNKDNEGQGSKPAAPTGDPLPPGPARKIIIRSGDIEFEVESFDAAVATITKLVSDPAMGGFIATVNSEKLPNGKVRGAVVVRVPPDHLDTLLLDLRKELGKGGELK